MGKLSMVIQNNHCFRQLTHPTATTKHYCLHKRATSLGEIGIMVLFHSQNAGPSPCFCRTKLASAKHQLTAGHPGFCVSLLFTLRLCGLQRLQMYSRRQM
jgi:hypothetical protein